MSGGILYYIIMLVGYTRHTKDFANLKDHLDMGGVGGAWITC